MVECLPLLLFLFVVCVGQWPNRDLEDRLRIRGLRAEADEEPITMLVSLVYQCRRMVKANGQFTDIIDSKHTHIKQV